MLDHVGKGKDSSHQKHVSDADIIVTCSLNGIKLFVDIELLYCGHGKSNRNNYTLVLFELHVMGDCKSRICIN